MTQDQIVSLIGLILLSPMVFTTMFAFVFRWKWAKRIVESVVTTTAFITLFGAIVSLALVALGILK